MYTVLYIIEVPIKFCTFPLFNQVLNEPKRVFFAFNDRTEKIISKQFKRFIEKELRMSRL